MKKPAKQVVAEKREWNHQPSAEEKKQGFRGWYSRNYLPHFDAPGVRQFITYRLADSIPAEKFHEWAEAMKLEDEREKFRRMELMLDRALGKCALRKPSIARMVQENLWFYDGKIYRLLAWVIMPNHVHVLAEMWKPLRVVLGNWKSYTASEGNEMTGKAGKPFWQSDYFDRYIRNDEHYRKVVRYIENNPVKAGLVREPVQWRWSSAPYRGVYGSDELPIKLITNLSNADKAVRAPIDERAQSADKAVRAPFTRLRSHE